MGDSSENQTPPTSPSGKSSTKETAHTSTALPISNVQTVTFAPEPTAIPYGVKLNSMNFSLWSQVVETFVAGRGKLGYLTGKTQEPSKTDASHERWSMENAIVKGWLIGAMEPDVMNLFVRLPTAKSIWAAVSQTYYEGADRSVIYDLSRRVMQMKQEGKSVSTYYADLRAIWQELDYRKPMMFTQPDVILARQKEIDEERVYTFLAGLDDMYDRVRSDILRTEPFPNPESAFATVRSEEQRRNTMLNSHANPSVAMAAKTSLTQNRSFPSKPHGGNEGGCTHCGNPKHVVENCFKLNGYPDWWKSFNDRKSRDRRNRKDGDKKDGKAAVMMSPTNSSSIASTGSILDPHLNSHPSGSHQQGDYWAWY